MTTHSRYLKTQARNIRQRGYDDCKAGKPIEAFSQVCLERHTEALRAAYEIGWRAAAKEIQTLRRKA